MAVRKIYRLGDDVLRKVAHPVGQINKRMIALLQDMAETMYAADGCGLAAPQVGILRRAAVIDVGEGLVELINPVLLSAEGSEVTAEGCLSLPGKRGTVERPTKVTISALNRKGEVIEITAEGFFARAICHELDHLDGGLYIDKMIEDITEQYQQEQEK